MGSPTTQRFAVFRHPENPPESWRSWSAYTRDFNTAWRGFVGFYEGHGATRRERKADAIKRARADNRDPMDGIDPTPPAPADDASGAKPVAWAVRDRHGQYGEPSRDEAKIRRDCDYLNRDSSTPYYIGQGPYEVVPLAPLPASDDAVEEAARALLNARRRDGCLYCVCGRLMTGNVAHQPDCAWERLDAALRREKGGA